MSVLLFLLEWTVSEAGESQRFPWLPRIRLSSFWSEHAWKGFLCSALGILFVYPENLTYKNYLEFSFKNIDDRVYGSTEAFLADTKWILHNCTIYNGS